MTHNWTDLQKMTEEEVIAKIDELGRSAVIGAAAGVQWYLDEMTRRQTRRLTEANLEQTEQVRVLTAKIERLTRVIVWLTAVAVVATIVGLFV